MNKALLILSTMVVVVACTATTIATLPDKEMMGDPKEKCFDKCYEKCINCIVKCDVCGLEHHCDSLCEKCGGICKGEEYCPHCGAKYPPKSIDGICDNCGNECYWLKFCDKCGHNQYYNGFCNKCGAECHYVKCCYTFCDKYCYVDTTCKEHCPGCDELPKTCNTCMNTAEELKPKIYKPMMQDP